MIPNNLWFYAKRLLDIIVLFLYKKYNEYRVIKRSSYMTKGCTNIRKTINSVNTICNNNVCHMTKYNVIGRYIEWPLYLPNFHIGSTNWNIRQSTMQIFIIQRMKCSLCVIIYICQRVRKNNDFGSTKPL